MFPAYVLVDKLTHCPDQPISSEARVLTKGSRNYPYPHARFAHSKVKGADIGMPRGMKSQHSGITPG